MQNSKRTIIRLSFCLAGLSGEELLPKLDGVPVIVVSAKAAADSKVKLLTGGAADYVTKPFDIAELLARIELRIKEAGEKTVGVYERDGITLDDGAHAVSAGGKALKLTKTEYAILKTLMKNSDRVTARDALLCEIEKDTPDCTESSLKTHISNLRKKLRDATGNDCIENVWGIGFKLK